MSVINSGPVGKWKEILLRSSPHGPTLTKLARHASEGYEGTTQLCRNSEMVLLCSTPGCRHHCLSFVCRIKGIVLSSVWQHGFLEKFRLDCYHRKLTFQTYSKSLSQKRGPECILIVSVHVLIYTRTHKMVSVSFR